MALPVGATMPSFSLPGSDGSTWSDAKLIGTPYVLTFYPKDETPGCVAQVCAFRDAWQDFAGTGVMVFGVSRDGLASHEAFVKNRALPYTLLSDERAVLHKALQVGRNLLGGANRVSVLIDAKGTIVEVYESNLQPASHAERMLAAAAKL